MWRWNSSDKWDIKTWKNGNNKQKMYTLVETCLIMFQEQMEVNGQILSKYSNMEERDVLINIDSGYWIMKSWWWILGSYRGRLWVVGVNQKHVMEMS